MDNTIAEKYALSTQKTASYTGQIIKTTAKEEKIKKKSSQMSPRKLGNIPLYPDSIKCTRVKIFLNQDGV